jgi:hypothetical protein
MVYAQNKTERDWEKTMGVGRGLVQGLSLTINKRNSIGIAVVFSSMLKFKMPSNTSIYIVKNLVSQPI